MSEDGQAFYSEYKPTIWNRLGFGMAHVETWEELGFCESAMCSDTYIKFDWKDRLRLLVGAGLHVAIKTKTEAPVTGRLSSRSGVRVMPPGSL